MIEVKDVSFVYSKNTPYETTALNHIDFTIGNGEFVGIIGHTGSGKSTLVNIIGGIVKPTKGRVLIDGVDITEMKSVTKTLGGKVGIVFQYPEYQLFEETVYKDIAFGPRNLGCSEEEVDARVKEAMHMTDLPEALLEKSPFELSGGQKRRVAIAGILSMKPKILILDEPAAGLDPQGREEILGEIKRMHSNYGITVLLVSHNMEEVAEICEKVIVIAKGEILRYAAITEVFAQSDVLEKHGLAVPQITQIMTRLHKAGLPVREDIYRVEDAKEELLSLLLGGEGA